MAPCHDGSVRRAGMAIGRQVQQCIRIYAVWMGGAGLPMDSRVGREGLGGGGLPMVSRVSL